MDFLGAPLVVLSCSLTVPFILFFFEFRYRLHDVYILKYFFIYLTALGLHCSISRCGMWAPECRGSTDLGHVGSQCPDQISNPCPLRCKANP